ncbi:hypothetical protein [Butyrivibrio sp. CB08]|nr:hypothetical protein [Butyrivibrio sp. CB08]
MNTTAIAITGIICLTLLAFQIVSEAGKTKRRRLELAAGITESEGAKNE